MTDEEKYVFKTVLYILMVMILTPYFIIVSKNTMKTTMDSITIWLDKIGWFD